MLGWATLWAVVHPAKAASPIAAELTRETQRLSELVQDGNEEAGPLSAPIMVRANCSPQRQRWTGRCETAEAIVPFQTSGPGTAFWNYVALFRIVPKETKSEAFLRGTDRASPKRVALVTCAFVPEPFGIIDWRTARAVKGYVLVRTRHWVEGDGHSNPSRPGTVRIDLDGGLKLTNIP